MANSLDYWENGFPLQGIEDNTNGSGTMNFWENGFPYNFIFPTAGTPPSGTPRSYGFIIG